MSRTTVMLINRPDKIFMRRKVTIAGIECVVERKNTRRLHIYIKPPEGEVLVTAPFLYTEREIKAFVSSKADWIRKHQERFRNKPKQSRMALEYISGETLYFWGRPYELNVTEDAGRKRGRLILEPEPVFDINGRGSSVCEQGEALLIMPPGSTTKQREQLVKRKYKELLEKEAGSVLAFWSEKTGFVFSEWHSRYMKSRWGSLSVKDKRVCLNTRLAEKPEICLVYVALHEVAHVQEPNHGPRFKAILDKYMPEWHKAERLLKS